MTHDSASAILSAKLVDVAENRSCALIERSENIVFVNHRVNFMQEFVNFMQEFASAVVKRRKGDSLKVTIQEAKQRSRLFSVIERGAVYH